MYYRLGEDPHEIHRGWGHPHHRELVRRATQLLQEGIPGRGLVRQNAQARDLSKINSQPELIKSTIHQTRRTGVRARRGSPQQERVGGRRPDLRLPAAHLRESQPGAVLQVPRGQRGGLCQGHLQGRSIQGIFNGKNYKSNLRTNEKWLYLVLGKTQEIQGDP